MDLSQVVTFVAVRLALTEQQREKLMAPPTSSRLMLTSGGRPHDLLATAPATAKKLQDIIAIVAQQFSGFVFNLRAGEVSMRSLLLGSCQHCSSFFVSADRRLAGLLIAQLTLPLSSV